MTMRLACGLLLAFGLALSSASAADAPATAADICKTATQSFPRDAFLTQKELSSRLDALGADVSDKDLHSVETSCKVMALPGMGGFAALPSLHLGAKDGSGVDLVLQTAMASGECQLIVIGLKGC